MRKKILLPEGCFCSEPRISPKSAYSKKASTTKDWCVQYRFYDPKYTDEKGKIIPHQVIFKGMNECKGILDRRTICMALIDNEISTLRNGYNPKAQTEVPVAKINSRIEKQTNFLRACEMARLKLKCADRTKSDIKSCLGYIEKSATHLNLHGLQIHQVRRRDISDILNNCSNIKKYWSSHLFNHYRAYLMMIFKKLIELEAVESNPVDEHLPKESIETKARKILTDDQIKSILERFTNDKYFLRFIHIFFHSGARPVELLRLKESDVDLKKGTFKLKNRKGNKIREQIKPIKKIALQYWVELMGEVKPEEYLFGRGTGHARGFVDGLRPGPLPAQRGYLSNTWKIVVKDKITGLAIDVDLYSLKHKNLDEIAAYLSIKEAQKAAGHESPVITMVYAQGEIQRQNERYAAVPNILGG